MSVYEVMLNHALHVRTQTLRFENVYSELCQYTHIINEKFKYFVILLSENYIIDKCDAIDFLRKIYNKKSNIESELIVYIIL